MKLKACLQASLECGHACTLDDPRDAVRAAVKLILKVDPVSRGKFKGELQQFSIDLP